MAPAQAALHRARPPLLRHRSWHPRHCWMAPAQAKLHRARPPLLRCRSRHPRHGWMAPAQAALHRARPPLLRRRSRRTRHCWMAPAQAKLHRARPPLLRCRSRHPRHGWMAPALVALHRARPLLLRRRSRRTRHGWMAPAQAKLHRTRPPLLRRRSRRTRRGWMAPAQAALHRAHPPLLRRRSRRTRHCWMAPAQVALHRARTPLLRCRSRRTRRGWMAPAQAALHRAHPPLLRRRSRRTRHCWMAPAQVALHRARPPLLRHRSRHLACPLAADRAARQMEQRAGPRRLASLRGQAYRAGRSPLRRRSRCSAGCPTADRQTHQPEQRRTRPANLFTAATNPRHGATFPRRSGATSGYATVDAAVIVIRSPGAAAPRPICCRSTTCCPSHRAVARRRPTWLFAALLITECATATDRLLRRSPRCSASCALLARRSTALADSLQVARRGYPSQPREPSVHLRYRLFRPGPVAVDALTHGVVVVSRLRLPAASGVRSHRYISTLATSGYNSMSRHASHRPTGVSCTTSTEEVRIPGTYHSLLSSLNDGRARAWSSDPGGLTVGAHAAARPASVRARNGQATSTARHTVDVQDSRSIR